MKKRTNGWMVMIIVSALALTVTAAMKVSQDQYFTGNIKVAHDLDILSGGALKFDGTEVTAADLAALDGLTASKPVFTDASGLVTSAGTQAVNQGGTGAATLTDGGILLGSGTGAITATAVLGDGEILVGDGTTDPVALDIGSSTGITTLGTIATGTWAATDVGVAYGGTGLSAGTSGGVLAYTADGTLASSGLLTQYGPLIGGGAGVAPSAITAGGANEILCGAAGAAPTMRSLVDADIPAIVTVVGGTVNDSVIGGSTPAAGSFTTLDASGAGSFGGDLTLSSNIVVESEYASALVLTMPTWRISGGETNVAQFLLNSTDVNAEADCVADIAGLRAMNSAITRFSGGGPDVLA